MYTFEGTCATLPVSAQSIFVAGLWDVQIVVSIPCYGLDCCASMNNASG
jgi:hypothetical protein